MPCLLIIALASGVLTLAGFWGQHGWLWDITNHFRPVYFMTQGALLGLCLIRLVVRRSASVLDAGVMLGLGLMIMLNGWQLAPLYRVEAIHPAAHSATPLKSGKPLKILHVNVLGTNRNSGMVAELIRNTRPDVLTLAEYNGWWQKALARSGALDGFQARYVVPYGNDGIYSSIPLDRVHVEYLPSGRDPTTVAQFHWDEKPVTLLMVHPRPPVKPQWYQRHKAHFAKWEKDFNTYGQNVLIVGDLNTSPWSYTFQHLLRVTPLKDSQVGFGIQPTWPTFWPKQPFRLPVPLIPIDHVLVSRNITVLNRQTGPYVGSDHLPVLVELAFNPQANERPPGTGLK